MAEYVATVQVPAWQTLWPADEVPHLTADALHRFEPEPDPVVTKAELRRFTSADLANQTAGRSLDDRELSQFVRKCKAAGLPELTDGLRYRQWGEYLEVFNQDAESRGWWAGLIPPRDPYHAERLAWVIAVEEHHKLLKKAIAEKEVQARMPGTLVPAPAGMVHLSHLVLTREALNAFAALLAMQVVDMPHFVTTARPLEVSAALLTLPDDARVSYEHDIAGWRGSGVTNAVDYRKSIRDAMARQAEGHFTLNEAAQVLADSRPGLDPIETVQRIRLAHSKGELPIHQGGSRFPLEVGETVRDFLDTVEVTELDAWLRASVGYGFPKAEGAAAPTAAADAVHAQTHTIKRRTDPLAAVLTLAEQQAVDAKDWQSVWAALVALALPATRPAPLLGYVEGEGVQYRADDPDQPAGYLSREAFRGRFKRKH